MRLELPVEQLMLGDEVRFSAGGMLDVVHRLHARQQIGDPEFDMVTVTHERGCWSKPIGELVIVEGNIFGTRTPPRATHSAGAGVASTF